MMLRSGLCFSALALSGCMDWDSAVPIQCRNSSQEQQQWASTLGLVAWVSLAGATGDEITINLHPYQNMDVEELHLIPLTQSIGPSVRMRIKPALEADWWLSRGNDALATPVSGRYRLELIGSRLQESGPRHAARCWRLATEVDFSTHVDMVELKAHAL